jgi:hypothetical protein
MKIGKLALSALIASACFAGSAFGQQGRSPYQTVSFSESCGCSQTASSTCDLGSCDGLGCGDGSCDSCGCGSGFGLGLLGGLGDCCLGEPWKLCEEGYCGWKIGGWTAVGYHTARTQQFDTYDGRVQLSQQWLYAEKVADGSCGLDFGGRVDYLYGTDGPDTQAFGVANGSWDTSWDNGGQYGHALPQVYGEVAYGNLSAKVGHFFTIIGQEVVAATGNFFYSRQFTFYNSEPFTHTGVLTNYKLDDDTNVWNGYVTGWDSGFEDNGDAYIGGFSRKINDCQTLIATTALGRFNTRLAGTNGGQNNERGEIFSSILTTNLTDKLTHIVQADYLNTANTGNTFGGRNTYGNINYLIYNMSDCLAFGQRFEYYNISRDGQVPFIGGAPVAGRIHNADTYNYTVGFNYRPHANIVWRPEMRFIWDKERVGLVESNNGAARSSYAVFGNDIVISY